MAKWLACPTVKRLLEPTSAETATGCYASSTHQQRCTKVQIRLRTLALKPRGVRNRGISDPKIWTSVQQKFLKNKKKFYSQCHKHLNNALYNKAHSLIGKPYLAIIDINSYINTKSDINACDIKFIVDDMNSLKCS